MKLRLLLIATLAFSVNSHSQPAIKPLDSVLTGFDYPFPVKYFACSIQNQQLKMAYMDVAPATANGKTIVLLHGKNFCGAYFEKVARELSNVGFRIIMPDQIGFGKSSKPTSIQFSFQLLAGFTKSLLDSLGVQNVIVLGHSMGGMLATRFALMFPERTEKLILEDPLGLEDYKLKVPYASVDKWFQSEMQQDYEKLKEYQQENYYANTWKPEYDRWVEMLAGWTIGPDKEIIARCNALTYDMIFTQPVVYELGKLKMPTLLIVGQMDKTAPGKNLVADSVRKTLGNFPALGKRAQKEIPNAKLVVIPGVGHLPHLMAFDAFINPLKEFLKQ